jgi:hypothetical protein
VSAFRKSLFALPEHRGLSRSYAYIAATKDKTNPDMSGQMGVF